MASCGMCMDGHDVGIPSSEIAYAHPLCPDHGDGCDGFEFSHWDRFGRAFCKCMAYQTEHDDQLTESLARLEVQREMNGGYIDNMTEIIDRYTSLARARVAADLFLNGLPTRAEHEQ